LAFFFTILALAFFALFLAAFLPLAALITAFALEAGFLA